MYNKYDSFNNNNYEYPKCKIGKEIRDKGLRKENPGQVIYAHDRNTNFIRPKTPS